MRAIRSPPAASRIERTTVVLPEPVPPATPRMQGRGPGIAASGSSAGAGSSTAWLAPRPERTEGDRTPGFYRLDPSGSGSVSSRGSNPACLLWARGPKSEAGSLGTPRPKRAGGVGPSRTDPRPRCARSALAAGAVEGAAARLDQAADEMAASGAGLSLATVGGQRDLELAASSLAVGEVVERGAALRDGAPEHRDGRAGEALPARGSDAAHRACRVDAGGEEGLAGVDVAEADDDAGVHEERLHRPAPAGGLSAQEVAGEAAVERFDAEVGEVRVLGQIRGGQGQHETEAARVAQPQAPAGAELEGDVLVRLRRRGRLHEGQASAHAEMDGHREPAAEVDEQVLGAPPHGLDASSRHARQLARAHPLAQGGIPHPHPFDHVSWQQRLEAPAKHLDLWQLGHGVIVPGYRGRGPRAGPRAPELAARRAGRALSGPAWRGPGEAVLETEAMEEGEQLPGFRGGGAQGRMPGGGTDVERPGLVRASEEAAEDGDAVVQAGLDGCADDPGRDAVRGEGVDQLEAAAWRRRRRQRRVRFDTTGELGLDRGDQDRHGDGMAPIEIDEQVEVSQQE